MLDIGETLRSRTVSILQKCKKLSVYHKLSEGIEMNSDEIYSKKLIYILSRLISTGVKIAGNAGIRKELKRSRNLGQVMR